MGFLKVHQESVTPEIAEKMCEICPFHAISYNEGKLEIGAGCKMCKLCVKNGVSGVVTYEEEEVEEIVFGMGLLYLQNGKMGRYIRLCMNC